MRMMLKVNLSTEKANALVRAGKLASTIRSILDDLKPEAAYFVADEGQRTGFLFLNLADSSEIPRVAEPWFLALDAEVDMRPTMNPDDLAKAAAHIDQAARKYGS
ncbi:MAG: hypothetical protein FJ290_33005 [Planctomycetes bacterium]|nr:hypothetical protein [Planctomycetota bacterium]